MIFYFDYLAEYPIGVTVHAAAGSLILTLTVHVAETGNSNPETNASLAAAIKRAKSNGVPKDNIEKAIQKVPSHVSELTSSSGLIRFQATSSKAGGDQAVTYEAMGPGSVGIVM